MKYYLLLLFLFFFSNTNAQKWIDLANFYWRTSPQNQVDNSTIQSDFSTVSGNVKIPVVLNKDNVLIIGLDHQSNSISSISEGLYNGKVSFNSSMLQLGWEHKMDDSLKVLLMSMTRLNSDYEKIDHSHFQQAGLILVTKTRSSKIDWKYGCYYNGEFFGPMLVPLFGFNWKMNDRWRLKAVLPINIELSKLQSENLRYGIKYEGLNASYRIENQLTETNSYLDKADNNVWLFADKRINGNFWIHFRAGHSVLREYAIYSNSQKMDLKISAAGIGDERVPLQNILEDGWSFKLDSSIDCPYKSSRNYWFRSTNIPNFTMLFKPNMRLDFIENINDFGESIVRLYDFEMDEAIKFKEALDHVILNDKKPLNLGDLDFIEPRNCTLALHIMEEDLGIQTLDNHSFFCCMTLNGYKKMSELLEPYCHRKTKGFKTLYDVDTPIDFLFAPGGTW